VQLLFGSLRKWSLGWGRWAGLKTYGLVLGGGGGDGTLRTSVTRVGGVADGDLVCWWCNSSRLRVSRGECREGKDGELGVHLEERKWW
jgi:hypothetical protein